MSVIAWIGLAVAAGAGVASLWVCLMNVAGWDNEDDDGDILP